MDNSTTIQGQWTEICDQLAQTLSDRFVSRWLSKVVPESIENNQITLFVPSPCIHELIQQNYAAPILSLWKEKNPTVSSLNLKLNPAIKTQVTLTDNQVHSAPSRLTSSAPELPMNNLMNSAVNFSNTVAEPDEFPCYLDKTHTFETFVVGRANEFAYAAAKKVAEECNPSFNPLYFHAGAGLGKTHLMHAIAWRIKELHPEKKVLYVSSEQFFQRFLHGLNTKSMDAFQNMFRSVDVLLVDDIQFILGKPHTQEEFFHTFNTLIAQGKTIILSADSVPNALRGIEERLQTRISQGLVADIHPAEFELRLGILQGKMQEMKASVPYEVLSFLAKNITSNVRELEGALKRIVAQADLLGTEITLANTKEVLKDILHTYERPIKAPEIQQEVADFFHISLSDLKSKRKDRSIARPRQVAMYLTKTLTPLSLPDIALCFNRDHTTIIHAVRTIEDLLNRDKKFSQDVNIIIQRLKEGKDA